MLPKAFSAEVTKVIQGLGGPSRVVAAGKFGNNNYQAQVLLHKRYPKGVEYILCVAFTDPRDVNFSFQHFSAGAVEPLAHALLFDETSLPAPFEGLGSIAVPYPS